MQTFEESEYRFKIFRWYANAIVLNGEYAMATGLSGGYANVRNPFLAVLYGIAD